MVEGRGDGQATKGAAAEENTMKVQILRGGSGKWTAREILAVYPNTAVSLGLQVASGHLPTRITGDVAEREILRHVRMQLAGQENFHKCFLGGGTVVGRFEIA